MHCGAKRDDGSCRMELICGRECNAAGTVGHSCLSKLNHLAKTSLDVESLSTRYGCERHAITGAHSSVYMCTREARQPRFGVELKSKQAWREDKTSTSPEEFFRLQ